EVDRGTRFILVLPASVARGSSSQPSQRRQRAVVAISNDRKASYVKSLLQSLSYDVLTDQDPQAAEARLWISDSAHRARQWADESARTDGDRFVVLLGVLSSEGHAYERLIALGDNPKLSYMRQRFYEIASRLEAAAPSH